MMISKRKMYQIQRNGSDWCVMSPWKGITGIKYIPVEFCESKKEARKWIANKRRAIKNRGW